MAFIPRNLNLFGIIRNSNSDVISRAYSACINGANRHIHHAGEQGRQGGQLAIPANAATYQSPSAFYGPFSFKSLTSADTFYKTHFRCTHSQSEGDKQFLEFLSQELTAEKQGTNPLPSLVDFKVHTDGPKVKFVKQHDEETISVEFDVNNSINYGNDGMGEEEEEVGSTEDSQMLSLPEFTVTIAKSGYGPKLCVKCELVDPAVNKHLDSEEDVDVFEIAELAMVEEKWDENTYEVDANVLDANMYDMLMIYLENRGIGKGFCETLVQYSTEYEHDTYIRFLESLQQFLKKN